ncbi:acetyl-coenzyme A transporter 1 [Brachionus plicatilis]|uniref:Acetyl-coenzyme A transporter 1 n=1 Tax=Brachionus plicatilis TaxID=10195 RepID=A0A3M7QM94_BRAPC|nr:acetyl-coenzyme A transporter 1 [Brachionus plicatilis]
MDSSQLNHEAVMIESSLFLEPDKNAPSKHSGVKKDLKHIFFLIYLYLLQGVPLGLAASIPFLLATRKVSYADQGTFTFAFYPFSIKLLWAPIVDSCFFSRFGRRKSWLIPVQVLIGVFMIASANFAQSLAYNLNSKTDVVILTGIFTIFTFLAATQDIALDGWAISMLSKENVAWQSTCNGVGQTAGFFIGNISIIVFESAKFCNKYIRPFFNLPSQDSGIISLEKFMYAFGIVFLATAFLIMFKKELENQDPDDQSGGLIESYLNIKKLLSLKSIQKVALIFLTAKRA